MRSVEYRRSQKQEGDGASVNGANGAKRRVVLLSARPEQLTGVPGSNRNLPGPGSPTQNISCMLKHTSLLPCESTFAPIVPWKPVPLSKVQSAPARLQDAEWDDDAVWNFVKTGQEGAGNDEAGWKCRGCGESDKSYLKANNSGCMTCETCGVVDGQVTVALDRQKACARQDDKTIVADLPSNNNDARIRSIVDPEVETASQARKRHIQELNGTRVSKWAGKKMGIGGAVSRGQTAILREARERGDIDSEAENKLRPVMCVIEACFDQIGPVHMEIQKHIRMEAARIVQNGMKHGRHCGPNCQVGMSRRSNKLIGICVVELCLQRLLHNDTSKAALLECSKQQLQLQLARIRELQLRNATTGANAPRAKVAAAVSMVADWNISRLSAPCDGATTADDVMAIPPSPLTLPAPLVPDGALVAQPSETMLEPPSSPTTPGCTVLQARDQILAATRAVRAPAILRCAALAAIQRPPVAAWLAAQGAMPIDVVGVAVLIAVARQTGGDDAQCVALQRNLCTENDLSATTAEDAAQRVRALLELHAPLKDANVPTGGDSIF
jgi:hypothetical protein